MILAAGKGTRLGVYTSKTPKPMLLFDGVPFLSFLVNYFERRGCGEIIIVAGHLGVIIEKYFSTSYWRDKNVKVVFDYELRGTASSVQVGVSACTSKQVFVCNGDTVAGIDFVSSFAQFESQSLPVMGLFTLAEGVQNQGAILVEKGVVTEFKEGGVPRSPAQSETGFRGSAVGCYFAKRDMLASVSAKASSLEREVLPQLTDKRQLAGIPFGTGTFIDFGIPERLHNLRKHSEILIETYGKPQVP